MIRSGLAGALLLACALAAAAPADRVPDLASAVPSVRAAAALALARASVVEAVPAMEAAFLRETDPRSLRAEARSLVGLEAPSSLAVLFLHPELFDSRLAILDPLGQTTEAEPFLLSGLADAHAAVRSFCLRNLRFPQDRQRTERAVLALVPRESDAEALREALADLGWMGGGASLEFLRDAAFPDAWTAAVAARSLARLAVDRKESDGSSGALLPVIAERLVSAVLSDAPQALRAEILYIACGDRRLAALLAPAAGTTLLRAAAPFPRAPRAVSGGAASPAGAGLLAAASYLLRCQGLQGHEGRIRAGSLYLDPDGLADGAGMLLEVDGEASAAPMVARLDDPYSFRAALDGLVRLGEAARPAFAASKEPRSAAWRSAFALWQVHTATRAMMDGVPGATPGGVPGATP